MSTKTENDKCMTVGDLIEKLQNKFALSAPVWIYDQQDSTYKMIVGIEEGHYENRSTIDLIANVQ